LTEARNIPRAVRESLGLSRTEAGVLFFGYARKDAQDIWAKWENGTRKMSGPTRAYFDALAWLSVSELREYAHFRRTIAKRGSQQG